MSDHNDTLFVSSYPDVSSAADDFTAIQSMEGAAVAAAVILPRGASGQTEVEHGGGLVAGGTKAGAIGGLVGDRRLVLGGSADHD